MSGQLQFTSPRRRPLPGVRRLERRMTSQASVPAAVCRWRYTRGASGPASGGGGGGMLPPSSYPTCSCSLRQLHPHPPHPRLWGKLFQVREAPPRDARCQRQLCVAGIRARCAGSPRRRRHYLAHPTWSIALAFAASPSKFWCLSLCLCCRDTRVRRMPCPPRPATPCTTGSLALAQPTISRQSNRSAHARKAPLAVAFLAVSCSSR